MKVDWISVEDRLPDHVRNTWVCMENAVCIGYLAGRSKVWFRQSGAKLHYVTHWAEIEIPELPPKPEPPREVEFVAGVESVELVDGFDTWRVILNVPGKSGILALFADYSVDVRMRLWK